MRKFFGFGSQKISVITQESNGADSAPEYSSKISSGPKYHIRDKDLRKIHKAASAGNIPKLQKILLRKEKCLNDRDKKNRTALHLACANGHPEVVTFLTDNKCELNFCDNDNRTALIKAIQCQHEECASILLKCGADPNVADIDGNTALHFAVAGHNVEMAEELLLNKADIEAKNKDDLTPLLLAIHEHKYKMAKFLMKNNANIHAIDRFKRTSLMLAVNDSSTELVKLLLQEGVNVLAEDINGHTAEEHALKTGLTFNYKLIHDYKEEEICKQLSQKSSQDTNLQDATELSKNKSAVADSLKFYPWSKHAAEVTDPVSNKEVQMEAPQTSRSVHKKSKEDSASSKPQMENSWSSGDSEELSFHAKNVVNPSLAKIKTVVQQSLRNIGRKYGNLSTIKKGNESDSENEVSENKVMVDTLAKPSAAIQNWSHPAFPSTGPLVKPSVKSLAVIGLPEEEAIKPVIGSLENFPHLKPTTEVKDSVPKKAVELKGIQTSKPDLSAELVLGRMSEKDHKGLDGSKKNPSQDFSASLPIRCAVGLTGAADQKGKNIQKEQEAVRGSSEEESVSRKPQINDSWSSGDSEELSFHPKNVMNPNLEKIKTIVQRSLKNIEEKCATLSTEKDNEADSENEVSENKVMVETPAKPSAAIQNWSHPAFPSPGPLVKPSVKSLAVIGLPEEEAIKPVIGNKKNGMDVSERAP